MFYLEAENQLASIESVLFDLYLAEPPKQISTFKDLPDLMLFPVNINTGELVPLPIWREPKIMRTNVDYTVVFDNVLRQLNAALKSEKVIAVYGELKFSDDYEATIRSLLRILTSHGAVVLMNARTFAEERRMYGRITSAQCMRRNVTGDMTGWMAIREGESDEVKFGPCLLLRSKNTVITINQNFDSGPTPWCVQGTLKFFGVDAAITVENAFVRLQEVVEDAEIIIAEIKRLFTKKFPFLNVDEVLADIKLDLTKHESGHASRPTIYRTMMSMRTKIEKTVKALELVEKK